ncbi:hypothetical protein GTY82_13640 [Streptomyces sp. SID5476]|uniref:Uncharacterized protein n=1 Tax=Streptomyces bottropensis ATCC 25435 TaxID=1054862 RepID=M3F7U9_9ACTN|nr:hypothetical protein SBD_0390 [Streptomyces bottropensis ATCC 25435]MZD18244.1 hypothetical protein [Streptomyces sp. SID5476]
MVAASRVVAASRDGQFLGLGNRFGQSVTLLGTRCRRTLPSSFTGLLWLTVFPRHTDLEFPPTPDESRDQLPRPAEEVRRFMCAATL